MGILITGIAAFIEWSIPLGLLSASFDLVGLAPSGDLHASKNFL